jgi:hypothetical protein
MLMAWIAGKAAEKAKGNSLDCQVFQMSNDTGMFRLGPWAGILAAVTVGLAEPVLITRERPDAPVMELKASGKLNRKFVPECSALSASGRHPGVFWTLSDSGNKSEIVPVYADGGLANGRGGVALKGVKNVDWEALTCDADGNMVLADVGNNLSTRKQLFLYLFKEPDLAATEVMEMRKLSFAWPDQTSFPDPELAHDCEAVFRRNGKIYLLTKHRRDTFTDLWCIEIPAEGAVVSLQKVARFDAQGMVTDASISPDGKSLAILTYRNVWVFQLPQTGEDFFHGPAKFSLINPPMQSWQLEGCAWLNARTLLIGSEQGDLYTVPLARLADVK